MNIVKMKITGYDETSNSLIVCFSSDTTKSQNPDDYPKQAYQPITMWPDVTDVELIKKRMAVSGLHVVEMQEKKETFISDPQKIAQLKALVGNTYEYSVDTLLSPEVYENEVNM